MNFFICPLCKLSLPITVSVLVMARINGKIGEVRICINCKQRKDNERNQKTNNNPA